MYLFRTARRIPDKTADWPSWDAFWHSFKTGVENMNFYNKKFRKVAAVLILLVIFAMVATMIIPYLV